MNFLFIIVCARSPGRILTLSGMPLPYILWPKQLITFHDKGILKMIIVQSAR